MKTIICLFILLTITHAHASDPDKNPDEATVNFLYGKPWIEVYSSDEVIEIHCEVPKSEDKKEISSCDKFGKIVTRKRRDIKPKTTYVKCSDNLQKIIAEASEGDTIVLTESNCKMNYNLSGAMDKRLIVRGLTEGDNSI